MTAQSFPNTAAKIFSGASDADLPDRIKDMPVETRRQWVGAWNGSFRQCQDDNAGDCEGRAFRIANAAIKGMEVKMTDDAKTTEDGKKFLDAFDVMNRRLTQDMAEYEPIGGDSTRACGNCQWYIADGNDCVVVDNWPEPINSNGISALWREKINPGDFDMDPIPVIIVSESESEVTFTMGKSMKEAALSVIKNIGKALVRPTLGKSDSSDSAEEPSSNFKLFKGLDGQTWWVAWTSNKFRDRDNPPEIFKDKAHKANVAYLDGGGEFPELWLWHTPGSKYGKAQWVDYVDGFLIYAGTIDPGMEHVAEKVASDPDVGVSHGYHYLYSDKKEGIIGWYRDFELSTLPMSKAANLWTGFNVIAKEAKMGISEMKRPYLVEKLGQDVVKGIESKTDELKTLVEKHNIEWKDLVEDGATANGAVKDDDAAPPKDDPKTIAATDDSAKAIAQALTETPAFKEMKEATKQIPDLVARMEKLETSDDAKIAAMFTNKAGEVVRAHVASASDKNTVDGDSEEGKEGPAADFFADIVAQAAESQ